MFYKWDKTSIDFVSIKFSNHKTNNCKLYSTLMRKQFQNSIIRHKINVTVIKFTSHFLTKKKIFKSLRTQMH